MIKEAIEKICELRDAKEHIFEGRIYTDKQVHLIKEPEPAPISLNTLTSFVDYIKAVKDGLDRDEVLVHVAGPDTVVLRSTLNDLNQRFSFVEAKAVTGAFRFGDWHDNEVFIIALQSHFVQGDDMAGVLKVVGNLKESDVRTLADDGFTQTAEAKSGIARVEEVEIPNPVTLRPYRTFQEIEQPASKFVLRIRTGMKCALFEADGGMWRLEAIESIKKWLQQDLGDDFPIIG